MGPLNQMIGPHPSNEKGHFELIQAVNINDEILHTNKATWSNKADITTTPVGIEEKISGFMKPFPDNILVKDPRFCLTMDIWNKIAPINRVVIVIRNPNDAVMSLVKRNNMTVQKGFEMFEWYIHSLVNKAKNFKHLVIDYEKFLVEPRICLVNLLLFLEKRNVIPALFEKGAAFPDKRLRHNVCENLATPQSVSSLYDALRSRHLTGLDTLR